MELRLELYRLTDNGAEPYVNMRLTPALREQLHAVLANAANDWLAEQGWDAPGGLAVRRMPPSPRETREQVRNWLKGRLAHGPALASELTAEARERGYGRRPIEKAVAELGIVKIPPGGGRNCRWALPR